MVASAASAGDCCTPSLMMPAKARVRTRGSDPLFDSLPSLKRTKLSTDLEQDSDSLDEGYGSEQEQENSCEEANGSDKNQADQQDREHGGNLQDTFSNSQADSESESENQDELSQTHSSLMTKIRHFPSQVLLSKGPTNVVQAQDTTTTLRNLSPTQFGLMVCAMRHHLTKHGLHDLGILIKRCRFFDPKDFVEHAQLRNRMEQLIPLLPLYKKQVQVPLAKQKTIVVEGMPQKKQTFDFHYLSILDVLLRELELLETGSRLKDLWSNHAVVRPLAKGVVDGKVFRSSPLFTFDKVIVRSMDFMLGSDVELGTGSAFKYAKITSIFMLEDSIAVYVQPYSLLQNEDKLNFQNQKKNVITTALRECIRDQELILHSDEILLKGGDLDFLQTIIKVVDTPAAMEEKTTFLCRYVNDNEACLCLAC